MMKMKVTIKKDSAAAKAFKAYLAEKTAFRQAAQNGCAADYARKSSTKFATPV
jgi:cell fate (sporulation/competence/biofilm development) regulator YlbF (YheA/YmcA/DUF963 family)